MGVYTVLQDPRADQAIQQALDRIVKEVLTLMEGHIQAIMLVGGFGRGEGGVVSEREHYRPVNDFDLVVMVSKKFLKVRRQYTQKLQQLANGFAPQVGLKQIDIGISHPLRYRFAANLVRFYEIKNGHKVLYGSIDLKRIMPQLSVEKLPLIDGTIYFLSRGSGLLIPALYFLPGYRVKFKDRENFIIELDKACLAMGDAILLMNKKYHYSYQERAKTVAAMSFSEVPSGGTVQRLYREAVKRKLYPNFAWPGDKEMIEKWFETRDLFSGFFLWFESQRVHKQFSDWASHTYFIKKQTRISFFSPVNLKRLSTMPELLFLLNKDKKGKELSDWISAAKAYLGAFHPQGVVEEIISDR